MNRFPNRLRALCLLALAGSTTGVAAQDCDPRIVGSSFHGRPIDVAVVGSKAYVTLGAPPRHPDHYGAAGELQIVDVRDPSLPVAQAYLPTPGSAYAVAAVGRYAYVADGEAGLSVIDVGDPLEPELLRSIETGGFAKDLVVEEPLAFVIVRPLRPDLPGPSTVEVFSLEDPETPRPIASVETPGRAEGLWIEGRDLYVADLDVGVTILDVSVPENPVLVRSIGTPGAAHAVCVADGRLFVADDRSGLAVIDLPASEGSVPVSIPTAGKAWGVRVSEGVAYVPCTPFAPVAGAGLSGLQVLDVSDPGAAQELATSTECGEARGIELHGGLLYCLSYEAVLLIGRLEERSRLDVLGVVERPASTGTGLAVEGPTAIRYGFDDMAVIDVRRAERPGDPVPLALDELGIEGIASVVLSGELAYVLGLSGLSILDLTDPVSPALVGSVEVPGLVGSLAVPVGAFALEDGIACIVSEAGELTVVDVSAPATPEILSSTPLALRFSLGPTDLALADGLLYVRTIRSVEVVDIGDPRSPSAVRTLSLPIHDHEGRTMEIVNGVVYVDDNLSIVAFDFTDPAAPVRIGSWRVGTFIRDFVVATDRVYVSSQPDFYAGTLEVIDFGDPSRPSRIGTLPLGCVGLELITESDRLYVSTDDCGLRVLDVSSCVDASPRFRRGDANDDGSIDLSDGVFTLNWLFTGGGAPPCLAAANANADTSVDLSDASFVLNHLFLGGPAPVAPFSECGPGALEVDEELGCETPPARCGI